MNDAVRQKLTAIVGQYGRDICNEPKGCEGLLLDRCAGDRREVYVLVSALEEQVVSDLLSGLGDQSWARVAGRLSRRLVENRAIADEAALWAVESWALALGVVTSAEIATGPKSRPSLGSTGGRADSISNRMEPVQGPHAVERREARTAPDFITTRIGTISLKLIQAGEFWMGSPDGDAQSLDDEKPSHQVEISEAFYLGVTPVTQAQYQAVTSRNPSRFPGRPENPVESVSWYEAARFCNRLSMKGGLTPYYAIRGTTHVKIVGGSGYRLPTEAEWEYACRAGTKTRFGFGDGVAQLGESAWHSGNSEGQTRPVGQKRPNAWGLHDLHGNVWEWCWDGYEAGYYDDSPDVDPSGEDEATCRVARGGSWNDAARDLRAASRLKLAPAARFNYLGFRVARGLSNP